MLRGSRRVPSKRWGNTIELFMAKFISVERSFENGIVSPDKNNSKFRNLAPQET
jgi:hypothetical protein